jgi:tetratricopeptide (TPR) repeat protein
MIKTRRMTKDYWVILLLGFLLYAPTFSFDYVLDDKIVITANQITKKGIPSAFDHFTHESMEGFWAEQYNIDVDDLKKKAVVTGGRYRPFSLFLFSIEYGLFGPEAGVSHIINALLYGLTGIILYTLLLKVFPTNEMKFWQSKAFWITAIFLVHPLHTEVVANIKSRDEILAFLFGIWSISQLWDYLETHRVSQLVVASVLFFLSLMSKETMIPLVVFGPLFFYFFHKTPLKNSMKAQGLTFILPTVLYLFIRISVVGLPDAKLPDELMNHPFLFADTGQKFATIFLIFAASIKLLFVPYPLTHDYYPFHLPFLDEEIQYASWNDLGAITGVILLAFFIFFIIRGWKSKREYSYLLLLFLAIYGLTSNVLFPVGVFMNERFLYAPSLIFSWLLVSSLFEFLPNQKGFTNKTATYLSVLLLVFGSFWTMKRSQVWKTDYALSLADVQVSSGSAKANLSAGDALLKKLQSREGQVNKNQIITEAYDYLKKSLDIHPTYFPPIDLLAQLYFEAGNYDESVRFYTHCIERKPENPIFRNNIAVIARKMKDEGQYDKAIEYYNTFLSYRPDDIPVLLAMAELYARYKNQPSGAIPYKEKAYQLEPENTEVQEKLGITYAMNRDYSKAITLLEKVLEKNPTNTSVMRNLGVAYLESGNQVRGLELITASEASIK